MSKVFVRSLTQVVMGICLGAVAALLLRGLLSDVPDAQTENLAQVEIPHTLEVTARPESDAISKSKAIVEQLRAELEESK